jgi:predicted nucleic-acid-binding Zn-ribbon protein
MLVVGHGSGSVPNFNVAIIGTPGTDRFVSVGMEQKLCPKCQSNHWMRDLQTAAGGSISLQIFLRKNWLGITPALSPLKASVCGDCGYTELYAENHGELLEEWRKQNA